MFQLGAEIVTNDCRAVVRVEGPLIDNLLNEVNGILKDMSITPSTFISLIISVQLLPETVE